MSRSSHTIDTFFTWDGDTLVVDIAGRPAAGRDAIGPVLGGRLKVSIKAAPEHGKATAYMVRFLAPHFGVSPSAIKIVFGHTSVNKRLRIKAPTKLPDAFAQADGRLPVPQHR